MPDKSQLRVKIRTHLDSIVSNMNTALRGENIQSMERVLERIGRGGRSPHWFEQLKTQGTLPNLDGKTIGSVIEMLFVGVIESFRFSGQPFPTQQINPARGVDLPELDLGIKSPSENYYTSEPLFSAYERILGSGFDIVVLLTDYQSAKRNPPLKLQIIKSCYLSKTEVADAKLCALARKHRSWLLECNESWAKKLFRFVTYVNQRDWRAKQLLKIAHVMDDEKKTKMVIKAAKTDFENKNRIAAKFDKELIPDHDLKSLEQILSVSPIHVGVIDALDNWVLDFLKDAARGPSEMEWRQFREGPLDGKIGMSFALQWRYRFARLFK